MTEVPNAPPALPRLTRAQANALRLAACEGGLQWDDMFWVWGQPGVSWQMINQAVVDALDRRGCLTWTRSVTVHPSDTGRAWLAANPDGQA